MRIGAISCAMDEPMNFPGPFSRAVPACLKRTRQIKQYDGGMVLGGRLSIVSKGVGRRRLGVVCLSLWTIHIIINKTHTMGLITHLEVVGCVKSCCIATFIQKPWPGPSQARAGPYLMALAWPDNTQSRSPLRPGQSQGHWAKPGQNSPNQD